jgi:hypothetical protein
LIGEGRVKGGQSLRREHQNGDENAAERRRRAEMLDAEIDDDRKEGRQRYDGRERHQQHQHVVPGRPGRPRLAGDEIRHRLSLAVDQFGEERPMPHGLDGEEDG